MAIVFFSSGQSALAEGQERVEIDAPRIAELIRALYARFPALEGKLDQAAAAIDGEIHNQPRYLPLRAESEVHFLGPVSGGKA